MFRKKSTPNKKSILPPISSPISPPISPTQKRFKICLHNFCDLTSSEYCCACSDKRPHSAFYEQYIDGKGFLKSASRHGKFYFLKYENISKYLKIFYTEYYCPPCKSKPFSFFFF